jgi:predicted transcriptional regulator
MDVRIEIADDLWKKVKATAAMDSTRNKDVVEDALTRYFDWREHETTGTTSSGYTLETKIRPVPKPSAKKG